MSAGKCGDPFCPCQDGDLCHYEDAPDGKTKGWLKKMAKIVEPEFATLAEACAWMQQQMNPIAFFLDYNPAQIKPWQVTAILNGGTKSG